MNEYYHLKEPEKPEDKKSFKLKNLKDFNFNEIEKLVTSENIMKFDLEKTYSKYLNKLLTEH